MHASAAYCIADWNSVRIAFLLFTHLQAHIFLPLHTMKTIRWYTSPAIANCSSNSDNYKWNTNANENFHLIYSEMKY